MTYTIVGAEDIDKTAWAEFVLKHPHGNIFQTPEMFEVYSATKNYEPLFVGVTNSKKEIVGVLVSVVQKEFGGPFGGLSARCVTWGGPLIKSELSQQEQNKLLAMILENQEKIAGKKAIYMQFRNLWDTSNNKTTFEQNGYGYEEHLDIIIDLSKGEEQLWTEMDKKRRNAIRKGEKENLKIKVVDSKEDIKAIYRIYTDVYKNVKVPLADETMFLKAHELLYKKKMILNLLAYHNELPIGAISVLLFNHTMYDWYAGGIIEHRNKHPNDVLPWEAMKWGIKNNFKMFDFGGAGNPNEEYGVRDFKKQYGGGFVNFGRYEIIYKKTALKIAKMGFEIVKKVK